MENKDSNVPPRGIPPSTNPSVGPPGAPTDAVSPIEAMGYGDFRGVIHAHSYLSHDSEGAASRMIQAAQTTGIQFILMTDHPSAYSVNHGLRGFHGGVFFLPGAELASSDGSILAIGLQENINTRDTQSAIDEIVRQGGVALFGHIEGIKDWDAVGWDGMEIYNTHYDAILDGKIDKTIALVPRLEKEPDRVWLSILDKPTLYLNAWDAALKKRRVTGIAANDSHENVVYKGIQLDTYERSYGLVNTHLFLMELSEAEILKALKLGHAYVCFEVFSSCRGFSFTATDGKNIAIMGDDFTIGKETTSSLAVSIPEEAKIQLLKDGNIIKESTGTSLSMDLTEAGVYRVEIYMQVGKKLQPWIYSNPIYVR
ncbi:MAG: hypothetical protein AB1546_12635 [bacterium]